MNQKQSCKSQFNLQNELRTMIFSNVIMAMAVWCMGSAQAGTTITIAGYEADPSADAYLQRDNIQKNFEAIMADNEGPLDATCEALQLGKNFWDSNDVDKGGYLKSLPTYTGSESDEWGEYTDYYGSSGFHIDWVDQAFLQGLNPGTNVGLAPQGAGNGKANFYAAFVNQNDGTAGAFYTPAENGAQAKNCVGFEESVKKATSYVFQFGEIMQLLQNANDLVTNSNCIALVATTPCFDAVKKWDAAVAIFVGSLEGNGADNGSGGPTGVTLWSQGEKRCADFEVCGVDGNSKSESDTAPINYKIMNLFAAGRQATLQGQASEMKQIQRLISNKLGLGGIQGTMRYAWRLGELTASSPDPSDYLSPPLPGFGEGPPPDKEVGEMGTFAMAALPKVWACSKNGEAKLYGEVQIGGAKTVSLDPDDSTSRPSVNFDNVKLVFECNYKCLGITCEEAGSLFDGQTTSVNGDGEQNGTPMARSTTCNDGKMGTTPNNPTCKKIRGNPEKKRCKQFIKSPGIKNLGGVGGANRDKLRFFHNAALIV